MSKKHPCEELTPSDTCNKTCCPDYEPDSDWCKAFNKRTLEQLKETTQVSIDGMWFNIQDAKNTIGQAEQYLAIIYELLVASLDQIIKISSSTARTISDYESASIKVKEYVNEIFKIVGGAQYNGRHLLQDKATALRAIDHYVIDSNTNNGPIISLIGDLSNVNEGNAVFDHDAGLVGTINSIDLVTNEITINNNVDLLAGSEVMIGPLTTTNTLIYNDAVERGAIHFRLAGPRGACRNVDSVFNDFVYELPSVGTFALGLRQQTSKQGQDYYIDGLAKQWHQDEGILNLDDSPDEIDESISDFNCAIKTIGVELDKLRSYRYVLCLREKQVRIYKEGQKKCFDHKCKI